MADGPVSRKIRSKLPKSMLGKVMTVAVGSAALIGGAAALLKNLETLSNYVIELVQLIRPDPRRDLDKLIQNVENGESQESMVIALEAIARLQKIDIVRLVECSDGSEALISFPDEITDAKIVRSDKTIAVALSKSDRWCIRFLDLESSPPPEPQELTADILHQISEIRARHFDNTEPKDIFEVDFEQGHGTGTLGLATRLYSSGDHFQDFATYEYNTGWGAFKSAIVEFRLSMTLAAKDNRLFLEREGYVVGCDSQEETGNNQLDEKTGDNICKTNVRYYKQINPETFVYDELLTSFRQIKGRTHEPGRLLSETYGDYADIVGGWFVKPVTIEEATKAGDNQ
jgi:hypothetical protein